MNITIRNISRELYQEFKAEAARRGLRIGEAVTLAMKEFVKHGKRRKVNILDFEPFDWDEGTEKSSDDIDSILYGDPFSSQSATLKGAENFYRIRPRDYRIIYQIT